jgi:hypothetical protein
MTEAERLREQAERCLRLAARTIASDLTEALQKLAADYLAQARALERADSGQRQQRENEPPPPSPSSGSDHQPEQIQPDKEED